MRAVAGLTQLIQWTEQKHNNFAVDLLLQSCKYMQTVAALALDSKS